MIVADYRRQAKSAPVEPAVQESNAKDADGNVKGAEGNKRQAGGNVKEAAGNVKEADASLLELVGRSAFLPQQPPRSTPAPTASLQSAPIIP
jgi:uncharacterized protein YjbJ (UPF0337 family)